MVERAFQYVMLIGYSKGNTNSLQTILQALFADHRDMKLSRMIACITLDILPRVGLDTVNMLAPILVLVAFH